MGLFSSLGTVVGTMVGGPFGPAIGGAIGGALDSSQERGYAEDRQDSANQYSSAQALANREFQERMSNTSYQRGMADMRAAGLNPMLAFSQGGASVPSGSMASYPTGAGPSHLSAAASMRSADAAGISSAAQAQQAETAQNIGDATIRKIGQEIANMKTDNDRLQAVITNLKEEWQNLIKEGYNKTEVGNHLRATIDKLKVELPLLSEETFLREAQKELAKVQAALGGFDVQSASRMENIGRDAAQLKPIFDILRILSRK